jgi:sulfane dehydrogenase subunit SoxC
MLRRAGLALTGATLAGQDAVAGPDDGAPPPWMTAPGPTVPDNSYGAPSPFERAVVRRIRDKQPFPSVVSAMTPLQDLSGIITPNGLHHARCHAGVPAIDPDRHRLLVHGLVDRPLSFGMDDLVRFPSVSRLHFLECSGNTKFFDPRLIKPTWTVQDTHGQVSCAEWTGVRLADVLGEAGVRPGAAWVLAEGADAAAMTRSIPLEKALDDAILAYAQNGERLRPENGYPLRLLLPGYEGNTNVKWLRRLKLGDQPFETREETAKYTDLRADGVALQFNFIMAVKSVITGPSPGRGLHGPGFREITGLAWSGRGRVARVEVSTDGGSQWQDAALQEPVLPKCLTRFRLPWTWDGAPATLQSRATDETGDVQPTRARLLAACGTNFTYHYNAIHTWAVRTDGEVSLVV